MRRATDLSKWFCRPYVGFPHSENGRFSGQITFVPKYPDLYETEWLQLDQFDCLQAEQLFGSGLEKSGQELDLHPYSAL